ncbi:hypothetical protein CEB3_c46180 [Peptococcaceae bacterium CEB3]|nr:hypothetical protein CEB3_c46180 [Peptococcaceae bacterium CEB3]
MGGGIPFITTAGRSLKGTRAGRLFCCAEMLKMGVIAGGPACPRGKAALGEKELLRENELLKGESAWDFALTIM